MSSFNYKHNGNWIMKYQVEEAERSHMFKECQVSGNVQKGFPKSKKYIRS